MYEFLKKRLRCILLSSVVANICLFLTLIGLIVYKEKFLPQKNSSKPSPTLSMISLPGDSGICVPCDYLGKDIETKDTLFDLIKTIDGHRICCNSQPSYLPKLIGKMIGTQKSTLDDAYDLRRNLKWWRSRPGSIHMYLDLEKLNDNQFVWKTEDDLLGVAYRNGIEMNMTANSIVISRKAMYFIYAAITFDFGDIPSVPIFYHNITKSHPLLPRTIHTLRMSKYGGSTESKRKYTSFLCGVFELQGDFNIKTEVSSYDYVSKLKYDSYFGMFRL